MSKYKIAPENEIIGNNIKIYRMNSGLNHKNLCRKIHKEQNVTIKTATIKAYEAGKCSISAINLHYISIALNIDTENFYIENCHSILLDNNSLKLLEAYKAIKLQLYRDTILHIANGLAKNNL